MKVSRSELLAALNAAAPGVASKELDAQTQSFSFSGGRVYTFNDKVAVSYPLPENWGLEGAVHAPELLKLLSKMSGEEVTIAVNTGMLVVSNATTRAEVKLEAEMARPYEAVGVPAKWVKLPADFWKGAKMASFVASTSMAKPALMFIHIKGDTIKATDNFRLLVQKIKGNMPEMLIPAKVVPIFQGAECVEAGKTSGWLHFRNKAGVTYSCRTLDGEIQYPDLDDLLEVDGIKVELPKELRKGLEKATAVIDAREGVAMVKIEATADRLVLSASGPYASVTERYKFKCDEPFSFLVNPALLDDALSIGAAVTVGTNRLRIDGEEDGWVHVVALLVKEAVVDASTEAGDEPPAEEPPAQKPGKGKPKGKAVASAAVDGDTW